MTSFTRSLPSPVWGRDRGWGFASKIKINFPETFIGTADFTAAGQVRVVVVGGDTCLGLNANNDLAADSWIQVAGEHSVDASWF